MGMTRHLWLTTYQTLYLLSYSTTAKCMAFKPKWQNAESIEKDAWYIPVSFRPFFLYLRQVETHRNVALVVLWVSTKPEWEGRQDDIKGKSKDKDRRDPLFLEKNRIHKHNLFLCVYLEVQETWMDKDWGWPEQNVLQSYLPPTLHTLWNLCG